MPSWPNAQNAPHLEPATDSMAGFMSSCPHAHCTMEGASQGFDVAVRLLKERIGTERKTYGPSVQLRTDGGEKRLRTDGGEKQLRTDGGEKRLRTDGGEKRLRTDGGEKQLRTDGGKWQVQPLDPEKEGGQGSHMSTCVRTGIRSVALGILVSDFVKQESGELAVPATEMSGYGVKAGLKGKTMNSAHAVGFVSEDEYLEIQGITREQSGDYECSASNDVAAPVVRRVKVTVNYPPYISEAKGTGVPVGQKGTLQLVEGKKGVKVENRPFLSKLIFFNVSEHDYGNYTCVASNKLGHTNASIMLFEWLPASLLPPLVKRDILSQVP
ncbi:hypothetical protein GH733_007216 [Mirounga leonina]|nr:hypothetical protein GH733_007216 [Mirounga leonina]